MLSTRSLDPRDIRGIMLIDEVEQHLHPRWQLRVMELLKHAFPKVQFIATTHSPLVISGCEKCRVHTLNRGRHRVFDRAFGWLAEDVYREIMGLPDSRSGLFNDQVLDRYEALYRKTVEGRPKANERAEFASLKRQLRELPESDPVRLTTEISTITKWLRGKRRDRR
jgi:predicted ATP-binding protein involved in virulence